MVFKCMAGVKVISTQWDTRNIIDWVSPDFTIRPFNRCQNNLILFDCYCCSMHRKQPEFNSVWCTNVLAITQYILYAVLLRLLLMMLVECIEWNAPNRRFNERNCTNPQESERECDKCTKAEEIIQNLIVVLCTVLGSRAKHTFFLHRFI